MNGKTFVLCPCCGQLREIEVARPRSIRIAEYSDDVRSRRERELVRSVRAAFDPVLLPLDKVDRAATVLLILSEMDRAKL